MSARIIVLATGGTISCTTDRNGHLLPTLTGEQVVRPVADRFAPGAISVEVRDIAHIDSASIRLSEIDAVVAACHEALADPEVAGVVVLHGTDSMEETAMAVDVFHGDPRPVIFTGAQLPSDHPEADGPGNLFEALVVASDASARNIGVLVVFGHAVLPVRGVTKWHTSDMLAFATNAPEEPTRPDPLPLTALDGVRVDVIPAYAGADSSLLDASINSGAHGLIIQGLGSGNVGTELAAAISSALEKGVQVVMTTRVPRGDVQGTYGGAGGGATLAAQGVVGSGYLRAPQARIVLAAAIASGAHPQTLFDAN